MRGRKQLHPMLCRMLTHYRGDTHTHKYYHGSTPSARKHSMSVSQTPVNPNFPTPPHVNGPGRVSSFEKGGPFAKGAMFLLSKGGGSIDTRTGGH